MTSTTRPTLEVHVLGGSIGESIILKLPSGEWGVIDCYARSLRDPSANATLSFLQKNGVKELAFLCLTHPHDDHFRGMSQVLASLRVRCFWRFPTLSASHLKRLAQYFLVEAKKSGVRSERENADEFASILRTARTMNKRYPSERTELYPLQDDPDARCKITAIAPCGRQQDSYERLLLGCFAERRVTRQLPVAEHNLISIALMVEFGDCRIILGGDVEGGGWEEICNVFPPGRLGATAVKVAHHGSTNGWIEGLWSRFSADRQPIAIITPFRRFRLPQPETISHISEFARLVCSTGSLPGTSRIGVPMSRRASPRSREAIARVFGARPAEGDQDVGICSFVFDESGECLSQGLKDPATILFRRGPISE